MSEQHTFDELVNDYLEKLELYTDAIARAHGKNHPEAFEVREWFETIRGKVKEAGEEKPDLDDDFARLRDITDHYTVPGDVCGTYAETYRMLAEVDQAYRAL